MFRLLTDEELDNLNIDNIRDIVNNGSKKFAKEITYAYDNGDTPKRMVFVHPKDKTLNSIKDSFGFDYVNSFHKKDIHIDDKSYVLYISKGTNAMTIVTLIHTFN